MVNITEYGKEVNDLYNLKAEMVRYGVRNGDIQNLLGCAEKTVRNKIDGETEFYLSEAIRVRDRFFPGLSLEYLYSDATATNPHERS
jgi:predicted transcriptional regulator